MRIKALGMDCAILGGYARDLYYRKEPKDMDICIFGPNATPEKFKELKAMLGDLVLHGSGEEDPSCSGVESVINVLQLSGKVDIIMWDGKMFHDVKDVLDGFDYNMNQFMMVDMKPIFVGKNKGVLTQLRSERLTDVRIEKMINKAKFLGWDTTETPKSLPPIPPPFEEKPVERKES